MLFSLLSELSAGAAGGPGAPGAPAAGAPGGAASGTPAPVRAPKRPHALREGVARVLFATAAALSIAAVALICLFLLVNGVPAMAKIGLPEFLFGMTWRPANDLFGIFPMIVGSLYVTAGAIVGGVPGGLLTAVYLSRFARGRVGSFLRSGVELLAGIPSVVYGFFGLVVIVPFVRLLGPGTGLSVLAASLILGIMILPTIITVAQSALDAVPATTRAPWPSASTTSTPCLRWWPRRPPPASWPPSCWGWAAPSARPWPWSWWPGTCPSSPTRCCPACAP